MIFLKQIMFLRNEVNLDHDYRIESSHNVDTFNIYSKLIDFLCIFLSERITQL